MTHGDTIAGLLVICSQCMRTHVHEGAALADDDHDTTFGFGDDDVDYISPGEGNYSSNQGLGVDYISPDTLVQTGESFDPSDHIRAVKMVCASGMVWKSNQTC